MDNRTLERKGSVVAITRLDDVFPAHRRRSILYFAALQFAILALIAGSLIYAGVDITTLLILIMLPVLVLEVFAFIMVGSYALEPLEFLTRTITHVSNQPHASTPPNLNGTRHERTGFKLMLETIYGLALREPGIDAPARDATLETALLDSLPGGVIALDESRNIVYANQMAPVSSDSTATKHIQLLFEGEDTLENWLESAENSQVSAERIWSGIQTMLPGEEGRRLFDVIATYQKNGGNGIDTLLLLVDRTDKYIVNESGMDFIALAAHELRGPITVIKGYLDILRPELKPILTPDQMQLLDRLDVSSSRLSGYVSNILNASKYDRRHLKLHLHEDRLTDVFSLVADDLSLRASTQGRLLNVNLPTDLPTIAADRNSLSEVIANLVDNAIKYSREGGQVNVTANVDGDMVRFSVQDSGVGIPASVVGNLFTKFYRSHRSKGTVQGTGLGLYISKAIVESHGGKIGLTSTEGEGSTFSFTVPTYASVKDKLLTTGSINQGIIETSSGWIKNHSMYRG